MTYPTNAEIEAAVNLTEYDEKLGWKTTEASIQVMREATRELLALRTGRHETHWLAPNEPTENMLRHVFMSGASTARILYLLFREAGMEEKEAMRSAAIEGEKDA